MRLFLLLALLAWFSPSLCAASAPTLDGRTYAIGLVEADSGKAQGQDTLVFTEGFAECQAAGKKYGYAKGVYTVVAVVAGKGSKTKATGELQFHFSMASAEHGELRFEGTIQGQTIQGQRTWSKPGKTPIVHRFTGKQP